MSNISRLDDLVNTVGKERTDMLFTEYFMLCTEKAYLLDKISDILKSDCTIDDVRDIVEGNYDEEGIYDTDET